MTKLEKVQAIMEKLDLPEFVVDVKYEFGEDASGEQAVWIYVIADDLASDDPGFFEWARNLRRLIIAEFVQSELTLWPYIRFRGASEEAQVVAQGER